MIVLFPTGLRGRLNEQAIEVTQHSWWQIVNTR